LFGTCGDRDSNGWFTLSKTRIDFANEVGVVCYDELGTEKEVFGNWGMSEGRARWKGFDRPSDGMQGQGYKDGWTARGTGNWGNGQSSIGNEEEDSNRG
jgi:hypothetical protein